MISVRVETIRGKGDYIGLAAVDIDLDGIELRLRGVRVMRRASGRLEVSLPVYRCAGAWAPAIGLPADLFAAIEAEVLRMMDRATPTGRGLASAKTERFSRC